MDTVVGDGASENQPVWKTLCTVTTRDILDGTWTAEELDGLPLDFKVGFEHPHPLCRCKVTIVVGGEMPHWGKKFRNALDNKSRELIFRGKSLSLSKIGHVWQVSGDADASVGSVWRHNKTHDHFNLNAC